MAVILARRMLTASTPFGRARLQFYMGWKRLAWRITIGCTAFFKRCIDIAASGMLLLVLSPVMIVTALLVRRDGGSVFFKQKRVGLRGREFGMLKFRSR